MESFINESAIAPLLHTPSVAWQEKRYVGEDFAGLEEFADFFSPQNEPPVFSGGISLPHDATAIDSSVHTPAETPLPASTFWKNAFAMGSAAAILIAASLGGLWAAHATAPEKATRSLPDANTKAWTSHSHRSTLPHTH
jgi:hypothetical protein